MQSFRNRREESSPLSSHHTLQDLGAKFQFLLPQVAENVVVFFFFKTLIKSSLLPKNEAKLVDQKIKSSYHWGLEDSSAESLIRSDWHESTVP